MNNTQAVRTVDAAQCLADTLFEREALPAVVVDQGGHDLGVGLGYELVSGRAQLLFQLQVVFYDAIVNHGHVAGKLGMGVGFGRAAMGGPSGYVPVRAGRPAVFPGPGP